MGIIDTKSGHKRMVADIWTRSISELSERVLWDQVVLIRQGLPSTCVVDMSAALGMTRATLISDLQLSRSSIEGRIKKKSRLTPIEGERVLRVAKVLARAEDVFDDQVIACAWLKRKIRSLGGHTPISLLVSRSGFELVMQKLGHVEYGMAA